MKMRFSTSIGLNDCHASTLAWGMTQHQHKQATQVVIDTHPPTHLPTAVNVPMHYSPVGLPQVNLLSRIPVSGHVLPMSNRYVAAQCITDTCMLLQTCYLQLCTTLGIHMGAERGGMRRLTTNLEGSNHKACTPAPPTTQQALQHSQCSPGRRP